MADQSFHELLRRKGTNKVLNKVYKNTQWCTKMKNQVYKM